MHSSPSKVASACICATREILDLRPRWPQKLVELTKYSYLDIEKYVAFLLGLKNYNPTRTQYKRKITDSGYLSDLGAGTSFQESYDDDDEINPTSRKRTCL